MAGVGDVSATSAGATAPASAPATRSLGPGGPIVPSVGFGAMGLSGCYGAIDDASAARAINHAIDIGMTHIDTADTYGSGHNEWLIGRAIVGRRHDVFLATKFGGGGADPLATGRARPELVSGWLEASLRRLRTDHVDLYYLHRVDPDTPIEDTFGAMSELVHQGKVRFLGISEAAAATIARAHAVHPLTAVQSEYSLFTRSVERDVLPMCRALGVGFVAYGPLSRGLLGGALSEATPLADTDGRRTMPRFQADRLSVNLRIATRVSNAAAELGLSPAQLALAWVLRRDPLVVTVVGSTNLAHLTENAAAARAELAPSVVMTLAEAIDAKAVVGERYPADRLQRVGL